MKLVNDLLFYHLLYAMIPKSIRTNSMFIFLMVLTICSTIGLQSWRNLFDNFSVSVANLDGHHIGVIQSFREIPGFLALLVVYLLLIIREHRLSALSILFLGVGVSITGFFPSFYGLLFTTLIMSFGFHYFETTNQSLTLQYFSTTESPLVFGYLRSIAAASSILTGVIILLVSSYLTYSDLYVLFGIPIILVSFWALKQNPSRTDLPPQHKTMIIRRNYWLFYLLTFMSGARRQIFVAFSVFLLVKKFEFSLNQVAILFLVNNCINYFLSPFIGKCINRYGERKVLSVEYFSLIFIFSAYALVESKLLAGILYIADYIFFNFAIAIRTFFHKIADPQDVAPSMAVGFTINHIAAVFLPALGGLLWMIDYSILFFTGAFLSFLSLLFVQLIDKQLRYKSSRY